MAGVGFSQVELVVEHKVHVREHEAFKAQIQFQKRSLEPLQLALKTKPSGRVFESSTFTR